MLFPEIKQKNRRKILPAAALLFLMFVNQWFNGSSQKVCLNILIWLTYAGILFIPKTWWTKTKLFTAVIILAALTGAGIYYFHEINLLYFLSIMIFSVSLQLSTSKSPIPALAALFAAAMFYIRFGNENIFSIISFLFFSIVLYFTMRIRIQRNEMYELNQQQYKQLEKAYDELQEASVRSMQYAVLEERTRIAREIHDAVGHSLTSLIVQMQALKYMIKKDPEDAEHTLEEMLEIARQGLNNIRISVHSLADNQIISGITPLKALLSRMETAAQIRYHFHSEAADDDLTVDHSVLLFRVFQEAITNIIRHSQATLVTVTLKKDSGKIVLQICDNGILNSTNRINEGFGIRGMKARLEEIGGRLHYSILKPNGFEIRAEVPLNI